MSYLENLDEETIEAAINELWENSNILFGIGEILQSVNDDPCLCEEAMFGLGKLLSRIGKSIREIKLNLEHGTAGADDELPEDENFDL